MLEDNSESIREEESSNSYEEDPDNFSYDSDYEIPPNDAANFFFPTNKWGKFSSKYFQGSENYSAKEAADAILDLNKFQLIVW